MTGNKLIFRATYFESHAEAFFEFEADTWPNAVAIAMGKVHKSIHDGLKSLEVVGKKVLKEEILRF